LTKSFDVLMIGNSIVESLWRTGHVCLTPRKYTVAHSTACFGGASPTQLGLLSDMDAASLLIQRNSPGLPPVSEEVRFYKDLYLHTSIYRYIYIHIYICMHAYIDIASDARGGEGTDRCSR